MGILPHCPYCHMSKHPQQLAGLTLTNSFVHLINIHNKYYLYFHVITVYWLKVFIVKIIARFGQDTIWQKHIHVWAFCPKQCWAFCPACIFFPSEQAQKYWYLQVWWNRNEIKENHIIQWKTIANGNISIIKPSNRFTSLTRNLHEIGRKFRQTWQ